ncbi:MAG: PhoH family protein, partial [Desulfacinum sp.]|nr:PhoH family protein [Desulfacinum sp.]
MAAKTGTDQPWTRTKVFEDPQVLQVLVGERNAHLKIIEKQLDLRLHLRGTQITLSGDRAHVELADRLLDELAGLVHKGYPLYANDVLYGIRILSENINRKLHEIFLDKVFVTSSKRVITPKSIKQKEYIEAIRTHD